MGRWWSVTTTCETERRRVRDLVDRSDPAVDGEHELEALVGEPRQGLAVQPVALIEPRRQVPRGICTELAQEQHGQRGRADSVGVVVAVHADARSRLDRGGDRRNRFAHVAEQERVVARKLAREESLRCNRIAVAASDEHAMPSLHRPRAQLRATRLHGANKLRAPRFRLSSGLSRVRPPSDGAPWKKPCNQRKNVV